MADITTALSTGMQTVADNAMAALSAVVPIAIPIFGGLVMIGIAIKAVRRFTGR